ncbi:hypothetical protein PoB_006327600 [Plakobranchus ocellatus]|uniref:Uncharacterized protein n=1 Tax=Plakobranchus ocellatus TaxID=259542 RepID=A0AAV4CY61_9GAST|nr:hypothetical protein PoB_006327600 [Plakobranchus ocellatus]
MLLMGELWASLSRSSLLYLNIINPKAAKTFWRGNNRWNIAVLTTTRERETRRCKSGRSPLGTYSYTPRTSHAPHDGILQQACLSFVDEECRGEDDPALESYRIEQKEFYTDVAINNEISQAQQRQAKDLLAKFSDVLSDLPGKTNDIEHQIRLTDRKPSMAKRHRFNFQHIMGRTFGTCRKNTPDTAESTLHNQTFQNNCQKYEFLVSGGEIKPYNSKTQKILDIITPTTKKEVRKILNF